MFSIDTGKTIKLLCNNVSYKTYEFNTIIEQIRHYKKIIGSNNVMAHGVACFSLGINHTNSTLRTLNILFEEMVLRIRNNLDVDYGHIDRHAFNVDHGYTDGHAYTSTLFDIVSTCSIG